MASAEQLLNEAQYAFSSINSGDSADNRRNAARANSLCRKIIRKFPTSTEAASALAILKRLGDEAFTSKLKAQHRHSSEHKPLQISAQHRQESSIGESKKQRTLNWRGLLEMIFNLPITSLAAIGVGVFVLFSIFGVFLWLPLIALMFFFGSMKKSLQSEQSDAANKLIERINAYVEGKRGGDR